ncbi:MAG: hypothetical protein J6K03_00440 [Oscillospiraceae bacterium]|nr:hypothetical protein [Oscillospiraceae bacterium]
MKLNWKAAAMVCVLLCVLTLAVGCAPEMTPYERNDAENFNVSVKFDANGGFFTTNTSVIVDSYNISEMQANGEGNVQIALLSPDDSRRGNDAFTAVNNGYFLAGWYGQRTETTDAAGNKTYTYADPWNFESDLLAVDASGTYTSSEPVLTLYAAWIPMFEIEFYTLGTGELLDTLTFDPTASSELRMPAWNTKTGAIEMNSFPERKGYTFAGAYYDAAGKQGVDTTLVVHPGEVDYTTGTAKNTTMKLYVDWMEGEWYHIYNVDQFLKNASVGASYVVHADLDFADKTWPTSMMYGNYSGTIQGNGHTFKNITIEQTNNSKVNAGLFGNLTETASVTDMTFENVSFTIKAGTRVSGANFGLLAGTVSDQATLKGITIQNSTLKIDSSCYFSTDNYSIGLVCGMGSTDIADPGINCVAVGDKPESVSITVKDGTVTLAFAN